MRKAVLLVLLLFLVPVSSLFAVDFPHRCDSDYFTIYYQDGVDPLNIAYQIRIGGSFYIYKDADKSIVAGEAPEDVLTENMDNLFNEVSDVLDIHLYSYHGEIKICLSKEELQKAFSELFNKELKAESFYYHEQNTIYITAEGLRAGILAHEMAHAIICHYFVVLPPAKVQEVLAGYAEFAINKKVENK